MEQKGHKKQENDHWRLLNRPILIQSNGQSGFLFHWHSNYELKVQYFNSPANHVTVHYKETESRFGDFLLVCFQNGRNEKGCLLLTKYGKYISIDVEGTPFRPY